MNVPEYTIINGREIVVMHDFGVICVRSDGYEEERFQTDDGTTIQDVYGLALEWARNA